jgi:hypothetical protein
MWKPTAATLTLFCFASNPLTAGGSYTNPLTFGGSGVNPLTVGGSEIENAVTSNNTFMATRPIKL